MRERKKVLYKELKIGQKICGYHLNNSYIMPWQDSVKEITAEGVILYSKQFPNKHNLLIPKIRFLKLN